jgi:hypothetical protein
MENIFEPNEHFNFENITLAQPTAIQGGAYFTKILYNNKSLYIQCPKCVSKQGIIKHGKKIYIDLLFNHSDESIIQWFINLENICQKRIFEKSNDWFQNPLELTDIESAFNSPIKVYKSCKYYLLRSNIKTNYLNGNPIIKIFNENEETVNIEDINAETNLISILEIQGIKFTTRNFQIEIESKQIMTMNVDIIFENCLIKKNNSNYCLNESISANNNDNKSIIEPKSDNIEDISENISIDNILTENVDIIDNVSIENEDNANTTGVNDITSSDNDNDNDNTSTDITNYILNDILQNSNNNETLGIIDDNTNNDSSKIELTEEQDNTNVFDFNTYKDTESELHEFDLNEIELNIEELSPDINTLETPTIKLKQPNEVYYDLYKKAKNKAKESKKLAIQSYLEAKKIRETYLLDNIDLSDDDIDEDDEINENHKNLYKNI